MYSLYSIKLSERMDFYNAVSIFFWLKCVPINVLDSTVETETLLDTSVFVQKQYLSTNYDESNFGEYIDMKNQLKIKNLPNLLDDKKAA